MSKDSTPPPCPKCGRSDRARFVPCRCMCCPPFWCDACKDDYYENDDDDDDDDDEGNCSD